MVLNFNFRIRIENGLLSVMHKSRLVHFSYFIAFSGEETIVSSPLLLYNIKVVRYVYCYALREVI